MQSFTPCYILFLYISPFSNKPLFLHVISRSLLKTLWKKEKLLITSDSSFSPRVFYPFGELPFTIFIKLKIVVCELFSVWKSLKFVIWERAKRLVLFLCNLLHHVKVYFCTLLRSLYCRGILALTLYQAICIINTYSEKPLEILSDKGDNAGYQHLHFSSKVFCT